MSESHSLDHSNCHWKLLYQMSTTLNLKMTQEGLLESIGTLMVHETDYDSYHWHWVKPDGVTPSRIWTHYDHETHPQLTKWINENSPSLDGSFYEALLSSKTGNYINLTQEFLPFKHALLIPVAIGGQSVAVLQFFSKSELPAPNSELSLLADLATVEFNRQLELYHWKERERDEVLQLAQASRLSALGAMAGGIAHEINNPLTIIMGTLKSTIKELNLPGEPDRLKMTSTLEKARQHAGRINKIVKGIRALSRDGSKDSFSTATIQEIVDNTLALCEAAIETNNIQLSYDLEEPELEIECRPVQISQVILNLINNSMDAIGDKQTPWIHVGVKTINDMIEFSVTDSGEGIPESIAIQLMQPFFTTKGAGKGTGLGLSISQEIIKAHSGRFMLDREYPNTRFLVYIPIRQPLIREEAS